MQAAGQTDSFHNFLCLCAGAMSPFAENIFDIIRRLFQLCPALKSIAKVRHRRLIQRFLGFAIAHSARPVSIRQSRLFIR